MRRRRLEKLVRRLRELQRQDLTRDELLLKLGAAKKEAGRPIRCWSSTRRRRISRSHRKHSLRAEQEEITAGAAAEGSYLLRSNLKSDDPAICGGSICNWSRSSKRSRS